MELELMNVEVNTSAYTEMIHPETGKVLRAPNVDPHSYNFIEVFILTGFLYRPNHPSRKMNS